MPTATALRYHSASPIRPAPADPQPDPAALARAVWRRVQRFHPRALTRYTEVEVCGGEGFFGIVPAYLDACRVATVDPVLALAQMLHETECMSSWWAAKPRRNPAGVFVTGATRTNVPPAREGDIWQDRAGGQWARGGRWPNWISAPGFPWRPNSVEAHVWRLAGYALPRFSPTQEAAYVRACEGRPLPLLARGSALIWRHLGQAHNPRGLLGMGWASPGTGYGEALARVANELWRDAQ